MFSIARLPRLLFDPRGRADRLDMLVAAGAMVAIEALLTIAGPDEGVIYWAAKGISLWIGVAVSAKRLHDLGYSAWWLAAGAGVLCIWSAMAAFGFLIFFGPDALTDGSLGIVAFVGLIMMPAIGSALWLHLTEGEAGANRFGVAAEGAPETIGAGQASEA